MINTVHQYLFSIQIQFRRSVIGSKIRTLLSQVTDLLEGKDKLMVGNIKIIRQTKNRIKGYHISPTSSSKSVLNGNYIHIKYSKEFVVIQIFLNKIVRIQKHWKIVKKLAVFTPFHEDFLRDFISFRLDRFGKK